MSKASDVDTLLDALASCPPGPRAQIDDTITPKLRALIGRPPSEQAAGLKSILDQCAHYALATDFGMIAMDEVWKFALKESK